jgi:ribosomal-protein-alanine N-acetyltransferase
MKVFRTVNLSDIEDIMELEEKCFNKYTRERKEVYIERIEVFPDGFIILENDKKFIGAVSSEIWQYVPCIDRNTFKLGHSIKNQIKLEGDELYISSIGILPVYRGQGFGEELFFELLKNIKLKYPRVNHGILLLNEEWKYAKKIYLKNNFNECTILPRFFKSDDGTKKDGIVMRNDIL